MSSGLAGQHVEAVRTEFIASFGTEELRNLARYKLDVRLDEFADTSTGTSAVDGLLRWADQPDQFSRWEKLLSAAVASRPGLPTLKKVCEDALASFTWQGTTGSPADAAQAVLLETALPFADRTDVRTAVSQLLTAGGWRAVALDGPGRVGKSYCHEYLMHYRNAAWTDDAWAVVNLQRKAYYTMPPEELARQLALSLQSSERRPDRLDQQSDERWAADLALWVIALAERHASARVWFVLDGFGHDSVPGATHEFIATLADGIVANKKLRLVLIGYPRRLISEVERKVRRVPLHYLSSADLTAFFDELDRRLTYRVRPACQELVAAEQIFLRQYDTLAAGDDGWIEAMTVALPGLVRSLVDCVAADKAGGNA